MRWIFLLLLSLITVPVYSQGHAKRHTRAIKSNPQPSPISLTAAQQGHIRSLILHTDGWDCDSSDPKANWLDHLEFRGIPLGPKWLTVLVQADTGCTRAGLGTNGAMWIIAFQKESPHILASPQNGLNGYFYNVDVTVSHGYRDIAVAWNLSPTEDGLTYLRFDGEIYRPVGKATLYNDEEHGSRIVPEPSTPQ